MLKSYTPVLNVDIEEVGNAIIPLIEDDTYIYINYPIYQEYEEGLSLNLV